MSISRLFINHPLKCNQIKRWSKLLKNANIPQDCCFHFESVRNFSHFRSLKSSFQQDSSEQSFPQNEPPETEEETESSPETSEKRKSKGRRPPSKESYTSPALLNEDIRNYKYSGLLLLDDLKEPGKRGIQIPAENLIKLENYPETEPKQDPILLNDVFQVLMFINKDVAGNYSLSLPIFQRRSDLIGKRNTYAKEMCPSITCSRGFMKATHFSLLPSFDETEALKCFPNLQEFCNSLENPGKNPDKNS
eukprot:Sdes_comp10383_c0_seq1m2039